MSENDWGRLSTDELVQAYADGVLLFDATEHVGRANRIAGQERQIISELKSRSPRLEPLRVLLDHPNANVRSSVHSTFEWLDRPPSTPSPPYVAPPLREELQWQPDHPPPPALSHSEIAQRLHRELPAVADQLMKLARPAIDLWPQRPRQDIPISASRLGGMPYAPPGWTWPVYKTEPLLFVGHLNCADLRGMPGAEVLPSSGLLAFFGDHDAVMACMMTAGDIAVFHWPDIEGLKPTHPPIEPSIVFPVAELAFRPLIDLPDRYSNQVQEILADPDEADLYTKIHDATRYHGIPEDVRPLCSMSKLFGWPKLVQAEDLDSFNDHDAHDMHLFMQIDDYSTGADMQGWGPGGSLYFLIRDRDLRKQRFDRCTFDIQFT